MTVMLDVVDQDIFRRAVAATLAVHHPLPGPVCGFDGHGWPCPDVEQALRLPTRRKGPLDDEASLYECLRTCTGEQDVYARASRLIFDRVLADPADEQLAPVVAGHDRAWLERQLARMLTSLGTRYRHELIQPLGLNLTESQWSALCAHLDTVFTNEFVISEELFDWFWDEIGRYHQVFIDPAPNPERDNYYADLAETGTGRAQR